MVLNVVRAKLFSAVKRVVDKHDPQRLLKLGAPKDEYDPESGLVADAIMREGPVGMHGLARIFQVVFHYHFASWTHDEMADMTTYSPLVLDLWKTLPRSCRQG